MGDTTDIKEYKRYLKVQTQTYLKEILGFVEVKLNEANDTAQRCERIIDLLQDISDQGFILTESKKKTLENKLTEMFGALWCKKRN